MQWLEHRASTWQQRSVEPGCGGQRRRVEGGEARRNRLAELGSQDREDTLRRHGRDVVLQLCQFGLVLLGIILAAIGGIFLNINLHLANGGPSLAVPQRRLRRGRQYR